MKYFVALLISFLAAQLQAEEKIALPLLEDMKSAAKEIRKQYEDEYAKTSAEDRLALAEKLLKRAELTTESPANRYVLYCEAMTLAAKVGKGEFGRIYSKASEGRSKTFATPKIPPDQTTTVTVEKDGIFRYDGNDYSTAKELIDALMKKVDHLEPILITTDKDLPMKTAAQLLKAMGESGFSRLLFKTGRSSAVSVDDVLLNVGILEKAVHEGMTMIAANKISDAMNEIRSGINYNPFGRSPVSAECLKTLDSKISEETDGKKKAALLVYRAVILLGNIKQAGNAERAIELLNDAEIADPNLPENRIYQRI